MSATKWILYCVPLERIFILPSINKCGYFNVIIYREYNHFEILHQKVPPRSDRLDLLKVCFGKSKETQVAHIDTHALHGLLLVPLQNLRQLYWLSQEATCCFLLLSHWYSLLCDMWFSAILVLIFQPSSNIVNSYSFKEKTFFRKSWKSLEWDSSETFYK